MVEESRSHMAHGVALKKNSKTIKKKSVARPLNHYPLLLKYMFSAAPILKTIRKQNKK